MSARRRKGVQTPDHEVAIIGAGLSGIGVARDLLRAGVQGVTIFERSSGVGGTWRHNTYPGIGVDVPAQAYQFRESCNPDWSRFYAKGPEVLAYVERLADEFGVRGLIRFDSEVGERHWDDDADLWRMKVNGKNVTARFVVVAAGPFPEPKPPQLPGLDDYTGTVLKSASWDHGVDLTGKRVAIVGTGASAVQIIPEIARTVGHLDVYQRTPIWIFPKIDPTTPRVVRTLFRRIPLAQRMLQESLEAVYAGVLVYGVMDYARVKYIPKAVSGFLKHVTYRMAVPNKELRAKLTPDYDFGCKRPAVSSEYLQTFTRDNVDLVTDPIETITATGVRTRDGRERPVDVLVLATGFRLFYDPQIYRDTPVVGRDGFDLADFYQDAQPLTYHGISTPGMPNYFQVFGHYGWTGGTWHSLVDTAGAHISRVVAQAQRLGATDVEVRKEAAVTWTEMVRARYATSLFQVGNCATANSYYFDHNGESAYIRPMSTQAARRSSRTFPLHDYAFEGQVAPVRAVTAVRDSRGARTPA